MNENLVIEGEYRKAYKSDAGIDIKAKSIAKINRIDNYVLFGTGVKLNLPANTFAIIKSRSSTMKKYGIVVIDGVVDNSYRGEIFIQVYNPNKTRMDLILNQFIAQVVLFNQPSVRVMEGTVLSNTERGTKGFGSSDE